MKVLKNHVASFLRIIYTKKINFKNTPIIINNYNRLTTTVKLIYALEKRGYKNIHILDNQSTYPPLLEYYSKTSYKVHYLKKNYGAKALWKSGLWWEFINSYYVYTDSDVVPVDECPDDFIEYFYALLKKYPQVHKVGFSLKIDDLPDYYKNKKEVIDWEKKFYTKLKEENVFVAPIDTTLALYRPYSKRGSRDGSSEMLRTGFPYQLKHLPWYLDDNNLSEEDIYYINTTSQATHWTHKLK